MNSIYDPNTFARTRSSDFNLALNKVYNFTYGWMSIGLLLSGVVAWAVAHAFAAGVIAPTRFLFIGCFIAEFALVITLSAAIHKLSLPIAALIFTVYAAINGVTFSTLFICYELATIQSVFFITAGTFAGMALFGSLTRKSLNGVGRLCFMGLWGIVLASLVNIFIGAEGLERILSYVGVAVFVGLTAWDAQKVRLLAEQQHLMDQTTVRRLGLLCALELYLDFINLFIFILRLFGGKGRD